jgi:hypothetical protein
MNTAPMNAAPAADKAGMLVDGIPPAEPLPGAQLPTRERNDDRSHIVYTQYADD